MESRARWRLVAATAFAVLWIYSICSVGHSPTRAVTPSLALLSAAAPPREAAEVRLATHPTTSALDTAPRESVERLASALRTQTANATFQCPSRRHAYGAAWLSSAALFRRVDFHFDTPVVQLEMASHDMFATAERALKTACYDSFFVEHLSAYGKHVKIAQDHQMPERVRADKKDSRALADVAVLIPFFTGEVVSQLPGKGQHSFGDAELRLNYAIATLCSVSKYFHGDVVFGVCETSMDAVLLERYLEHIPFAMSTARYRILHLDCGSIDNNLPSKTLAAGQRLYADGLLAAPYVFFTESDQVVWWRTPEALAEAIAAIDRAPSTYFAPYRLEETYLAPGKHFASRIKDTTGPVVTFEGRKYTVTNQCEHVRFPKVTTSPASKKASSAAQARRATPLPRLRPPAATTTNRRRSSGYGLRA